MKKYSLIFLILILFAHNIRADSRAEIMYDLSECMNTTEFKVYIDRFQEEVVFRGEVRKNVNGKNKAGILIVTMNKDAQWSVFESVGPGAICLMEVGMKGQLKSLPKYNY